MAATKRCKALGARLSVQLNAAMVNDATAVTIADGSVCAEHRMYGGLAFGKEKLNGSLAIITLASGVLEPAAADSSRTCPVVTADYIAPRHEICCLERRAKTLSSVDLSKAKRVVGVGRAWRRKMTLRWYENWPACWVRKWVARARLPKAKTGWNANVMWRLRRTAEIRSLPDAGDFRADPAYGRRQWRQSDRRHQQR